MGRAQGTCDGGRNLERNIANFVAAMVPQASVYAPVNPTNNQLLLDARGRFVGPGYLGGSSETYTVRPRVR